MSVEVTFEIVRKEDCLPYDSMWLGGNHLRNDIFHSSYYGDKIIKTEFEIVPFPNWMEAISFLTRFREKIDNYSGYYKYAYSFLTIHKDNYKYFVKII